MPERLRKRDFKANGILPESRARRTTLEVLIKLYASEINIKGAEHLTEVKTKLDAGIPVLGISDHLSNADGPLINSVLGKAGIVDPVFIFGIKLRRNPVTNILARGVNTIPVWPPSLETRDAREEMNRKTMNENAFRATQAVLNGGHILMIFPEGGRSYDGEMHKGLPQIGEYFYMAQDLEILPIAIWETEKRLPRKRGVPHRGPVYLSFGELIRAADLPGFGVRSRVARSAMVDNAMAKVAELLPEKYRGYYSGMDLIVGEEALVVSKR